ncbi:MAG: hypothetical protein ACC628_06720 [Pirellulaceae bacterium]
MSSETRRQFFRRVAGGVAVAVGSRGRWCWADVEWVDRRETGPFVCLAEFPLDRCGPLFDDLEHLQWELVRTLGIPASSEAIELLLFKSQATYQAFLQAHYPDLPYRRALYRKAHGPGTVFAFQHDEFRTDVRHEGTHALLHSVLDMVPLWLDEGLAEYFERPASERAGRQDYVDAICWDMRLGVLLTVEGLEEKRDLSAMGVLEYRFAWAWVHFMLHGPELAHRVLADYLTDVRAGTPPGRLSGRLAEAVPDLERQLAAHFRWWRRQR